MPCTQPSSPQAPCRALKQTSGFSLASTWARSRPASTRLTWAPSRSSASAHSRPETRLTSRSEERPPSRTATWCPESGPLNGDSLELRPEHWRVRPPEIPVKRRRSPVQKCDPRCGNATGQASRQSELMEKPPVLKTLFLAAGLSAAAFAAHADPLAGFREVRTEIAVPTRGVDFRRPAEVKAFH